jgi:glycosyltransferase involved in cell wall biosynthesis
MTKIKILHIQEAIGSGGVERRRLSLAKLLDKDIFDQKFVCTIAKDNIPGEISKLGFEVIPIGTLKSPFHWSQHKKVQKIIEDYKPDIIHGAVFEGVSMAAINGWLKRVPIIIIEETSDPKNRSWKANFLMKLFCAIADVIVGVSPAVTGEYLLRKLNLPAKKVRLINNGVAKPRMVSEEEVVVTRKMFGINDEDFVIGSVGRMLSDSTKRFSDLIKAFALFSMNKDNVKLLLIGEGPERINYQKLTADLNISEKVIFAGYQSDVTVFYRLMSVFSLMSRYESFGLVLAEAMLNKLPIVATRVGGMKYIVDDMVTGFLVEPFQVHEMTEKFETLYSSPELREIMSNKGFEKATREYTEQSYVAKVADLYTSLNQK